MSRVDPIIFLTEAAMNQARKNMKDGVGFRLSTKNYGCTGFAYEVAIVKKGEENLDDLKFSQDDLTIFVAKDSVSCVQGTKVDFVSSGLGQTKWQYDNPNVVAACGCGESFSVKKAEDDHD